MTEPQDKAAKMPKECTADDLVWWGEEGEWIGAEGHVDLASFTVAADALSRRDVDEKMPDYELPSADNEAYHTYFRPMTWDFFVKHYRCEDRRTYDMFTAEGAMEPCREGDEGAQAWTMIATGV